MKKITYIFVLIGMLLTYTSCQEDFLSQSSPSDLTVDDAYGDPQAALATLDGAFENWRDSHIHSNGLFYEISVCSSDAERHPEKYEDQVRHKAENLYPEGTGNFPDIDYNDYAWPKAYSIIAECNKLITEVEKSASYKEWIKQEEEEEDPDPSNLSHVYGMAVTLRATVMFELTRYYGDVINQISSVELDSSLTGRDYIYEYHINKLEQVSKLMFRVGENLLADKSRMTRTYAEGLIGRMCLFAGGYATRRTDMGDDFYKDLEGNVISFETIGSEYSGGIYGRRTDWRKFYEKAKIYLEDLVNNSGSARFIDTDPRTAGDNGELFGNPFQYKYQQMLDLTLSTESIYEIVETQSQYSERPYAFGRPSGGGSSNNFPCKDYGQSRMQPYFYYGDYDPKDLRRDVTVAVTGSTGSGYETLLSLEPGNKTAGGLSNNKWDENRMNPPYYQKKRASGVNNPYMHLSDMMLNLAEVYAVLGEEGKAKDLLTKVRSRAFRAADQATKVTGYVNGLSGEALLDAILTERKLELAGEGWRKWDMIRNGKLSEMVNTFKNHTEAMIDGIEADGYYTFPNGNQISEYIWIKQVDAQAEIGHRLTTECPADQKDNPILYPGWRGQYNDWENVAGAGIGAKYKGNYATNTAIKGLFKHIEPGSAEAIALEDDGYVKTKWGLWLCSNDGNNDNGTEYRDEYLDNFYGGFSEGEAPIYMVPLNRQTIATSNNRITNGYGFPQE